MKAVGHTLFDTAIGRCAVAWSEVGIVTVLLPERDDAGTRARLRQRLGEVPETDPPLTVADAIDAVTSVLDGENVDLSSIVVDLDGVSEFDRRVYEAARSIPYGSARTYGALATAVDRPDAARAVGRALGDNPVPVIVPCHRVVAANGHLGGFSAPGGTVTKRRMLLIEGYQAAAPQLALFD